MLILSEIPETDYLFDLYQEKSFLKTLTVSEKEIVTSETLPGFKDKRMTIVLKPEGIKVRFEAAKAVLINGVATRSRVLKLNDTLLLGPYRLVYKGKFSKPEVPVIPQKRKRKKPEVNRKDSSIKHILEAAALLTSLSFLWYCSTQRPVQKLPPVPALPAVTRSHEAPPHVEGEPSESTQQKIGPSEKLIDQIPLITYVPGETPAPMQLDILFIHAHPDDETLDYGLYIGKAAESGKKTGVITFTDGESGFDFYPDRDITGIYPDKELQGKALAAVRVKEEANALKTLGANVYVRLGLRNRPYIAEETRKTTATIIQEWGGEEQLIQKLTALFSSFNPAVIVSPDGPSKAREHFEHEAVGYITARAVAAYRNENPGKLHAYLKLVDVQQGAAYPGKTLRTIGFGKAISDIVEKKQLALLQYETQADASYYGIKRLKNFPFEYYFIQFRNETIKASLLLDPKAVKVTTHS